MIQVRPHFILTFALLSGVLSSYDLLAQDAPETLLLKDYTPRSIYVIPQSRIEKAKHPIIDMHSHAYADGPEEIAQWVSNMDDVGIEKSIILTEPPVRGSTHCRRAWEVPRPLRALVRL